MLCGSAIFSRAVNLNVVKRMPALSTTLGIIYSIALTRLIETRTEIREKCKTDIKVRIIITDAIISRDGKAM
jgi:hypothetical protein